MGNLIMDEIPSEKIKKYNIKLIDTMVEAGSGAMPIDSLKSIGVTFNKEHITPNALSKRFRSASPPIVGYIKENQYIIDLKAIPLNCSNTISSIICKILS